MQLTSVCQPECCFDDWIDHDGYCFGYGGSAVSWGEAHAICQSQGYTLAEASNYRFNKFFAWLATNKSANCVWLGGSDIFQEGYWEWSSSHQNFKFTDWRNREPNNGKNDEDCLYIERPFNRGWNDGNCNNKCSFICAAPYQILPTSSPS
ncbi:hypothetical protein BsWGS_11919 [Bradybaena similaris]